MPSKELKAKKLSGIFRVLVLAMIMLLALDLVCWMFWIVFCVAIGVEAALYVVEKGEQDGERTAAD